MGEQMMESKEYSLFFINYLTEILSENFPDYKVLVICKRNVAKTAYIVDKDRDEIVLLCNELISVIELHNVMMKIRKFIRGEKDEI